MTESTFFIPGEPATFATKSERAWREAIRANAPRRPSGSAETGVRMRFVVSSLVRAGHQFDLDNLCEPVFAVLTRDAGWFGGSRRGVDWWHASRAVSTPSGCEVQMVTDLAVPAPGVGLHGVYRGPRPRHGRSPELAAWASAMPPVDGPHLVLHLAFGDGSLNIADISTGVVKATLDCLYPILGGVAGAPDDHRINELFVRRGAPDRAPDEIGIWLGTHPEENAPADAGARKGGG